MKNLTNQKTDNTKTSIPGIRQKGGLGEIPVYYDDSISKTQAKSAKHFVANCLKMNPSFNKLPIAQFMFVRKINNAKGFELEKISELGLKTRYTVLISLDCRDVSGALAALAEKTKNAVKAVPNTPKNPTGKQIYKRRPQQAILSAALAVTR